MSSPSPFKSSGKLPQKLPAPRPPEQERERLRDIIIVFVTYPLTPNERTGKLADKKPWLEFASLLLKVALAAYALYEGVFHG